MIRRGECKRCGKCCTLEGLEIGVLRNKQMCEMVGSKDAGVWDAAQRTIAYMRECGLNQCPNLKYSSDGTAVCTIYDNRPPGCRLHPSDETCVVPGCGYYFEEEADIETEVQTG